MPSPNSSEIRRLKKIRDILNRLIRGMQKPHNLSPRTSKSVNRRVAQGHINAVAKAQAEINMIRRMNPSYKGRPYVNRGAGPRYALAKIGQNLGEEKRRTTATALKALNSLPGNVKRLIMART
jgi:hypothetical protein